MCYSMLDTAREYIGKYIIVWSMNYNVTKIKRNKCLLFGSTTYFKWKAKKKIYSCLSIYLQIVSCNSLKETFKKTECKNRLEKPKTHDFFAIAPLMCYRHSYSSKRQVKLINRIITRFFVLMVILICERIYLHTRTEDAS